MISNDKELEITKNQLSTLKKSLRFTLKKDNLRISNIVKDALRSEIKLLSQQIKEYKKSNKLLKKQ